MEATRLTLQALENPTCAAILKRSRQIIRLQIVTLGWMLIECGVAFYSAWRAHSTALLAFGSDSFVELLSAAVVLLQFSPWRRLSAEKAARPAGILLFILAGVVAFTSVSAILLGVCADTSPAGMALTVAALVIMPPLGWAKRKAAAATHNRALAADAVQSATCAYLAAITLAGLAVNALFRIRWIDPLAAIAAIPILCIEGRRALRGEACGCC